VFEVPETRYAKSGDVSIAYQVVGDGPFDLIHVPMFVSNLELLWEDPAERRYFERLASFCRLIMFDKRGTGLSDRVAVATLEERMDDLRAVMDEVDSQRAAVFGRRSPIHPLRRDIPGACIGTRPVRRVSAHGVGA
jgi:pimeloyl-ACP methyl ester carboxylesterase